MSPTYTEHIVDGVSTITCDTCEQVIGTEATHERLHAAAVVAGADLRAYLAEHPPVPPSPPAAADASA